MTDNGEESKDTNCHLTRVDTENFGIALRRDYVYFIGHRYHSANFVGARSVRF